MKRAIVAAVALIGLAAATPAAAAPRCLPPLGTLVYQVMNDGLPVGEVRIDIEGAGDSRRIRSRVEVELSVLAVIALSYRHQSEELWRDGAFRSFRGLTDDIGKHYEVAIEADGGDMRMTRNGGPRNAEGPLMNWAVWCEAALRQARVVDPLKGKLKGISSSFLGTQPVDLGGRTIVCRHYRVVRKDTAGEVWYGPDGIVVKARFPTAIGTTGTAVLMENSTLRDASNKLDQSE